MGDGIRSPQEILDHFLSWLRPLSNIHSSLVKDAEKIDWLRLAASENVGPRTFYSLIRKFGNAAEALKFLPDLAGRGGKKAIKISSRDEAAGELEKARKYGARVLTSEEGEYPSRLRQTYDPPPVIYVMGNAALLNLDSIAIVGTRNSSANGCVMARKLAGDLGAKGFVVISGMARGIDAEAHKAALKTGTVAVLAGGIDQIYPPENRELYKQIAEKGAIVAECAMGTAPQARHFPQRNRIVAGMANALVVVEAALKSGSLITADFALKEGRDVFAVPGSPLDPRCQGTNLLLRNGAQITENADDVIQNLGKVQTSSFREIFDDEFIQEEFFTEAPDTESARSLVMDKLSAAPSGLDEIALETGLPIRVVSQVALELELAGKLERKFGNKVNLLLENNLL